ncbi:hypothetical protein [Amycolatopsis sp. CA-128772]|uniref:hypothetical protein n=1 Tax=Amycolatopsis sp. CA-128772 TaxID=2073159 RepID=UPI001304C753|nr:hypothetical protein [Amycolatopsis sp. CA-128772]
MSKDVAHERHPAAAAYVRGPGSTGTFPRAAAGGQILRDGVRNYVSGVDFVRDEEGTFRIGCSQT